MYVMQKSGIKQKRRPQREAGQGLVEYALILALVSLVSIVALTLLGGSVAHGFEKIVCAFQGGGDDCEALNGGGVCADEVITENYFFCFSGDHYVLFKSTCEGTHLDLQGPHSGSLTNSPGTNEYGNTFPFTAACSGVADFGRPTGSFKIVSHHPDGKQKTYTPH